MESPPYAYHPIGERPTITWPGDAKVAFYVGLNVEHFQFGVPSTSLNEGTSALRPDPLNHGWRDYGPRVGIWRIIDILDRHGLPASALLNSSVVLEYPQILEAGIARDWVWLGHGRDNSTLQAGMTEQQERTYLTDVLTTLERATGSLPRGWLGPALSESFATPSLLAELGVEYLLDWTNDDQPYQLSVPGMLSVPYTVELNDLAMFLFRNMSGPEFVQAVRDQLDQLVEDSRDSGRVMALAIHPFVSGQPFRARYLHEALRYVVGHPEVWATTSDAIADHYGKVIERGSDV